MNAEIYLAKILFTTKLRLRFYEKMSRYLSNGIPVSYALNELYEFTTERGKKESTTSVVVRHVLRSVRNGLSFSEALTPWVPSDELSILSAGEHAGKLSEAINNIIYINQTKKKIKSALFGIAYPIVLILTTCLYLYIFGNRVVPAFSQVLPVEKWQGTGRALYYLALFVQNYLILTICVIVFILMMIIFTFGIWTGKVRLFFDKFPPWTVYKTVVGCGYLLSLSSLIEAGISVPDALRIMARTATPWYQERLLSFRLMLLNGARNIGEAMHLSGYVFPSKHLVMDIRSYAALDGFEMMLGKLSRQWQDESIAAISAQMDVLRYVAIVFMGFVFMWIVSGMFALQQQISQAAQFQ